MASSASTVSVGWRLGLFFCLGGLQSVLAASAASGFLMKGISYGVSPMYDPGTLPDDDFACSDAKPQWGEPGRGDLAVMKQLGANSVRIYGNDPRLDHEGFLDTAHSLGLQVVAGISDWPYMQAPGNCLVKSDFDCYEQVKSSYLETLRSGFAQNGSYHPAVSYMTLMNEPDLKLPNIDSPKAFTKAIISALDGLLDAEKQAGVTQHLPNLTVTFSFALCPRCGALGDTAGLGQMWQLRDAMLNGSTHGYDYVARNDLAEVYRSRFVNSFNTGNPASQIRPLFLESYERELPGVPVFIAEYHSPSHDAGRDLKGIMRVAEASPELIGISFFEFQLRTDIGGHLDYGMFSPGDGVVAFMTYFGTTYPIRCLIPVEDPHSYPPSTLPVEVAEAYGGYHSPSPNCSRTSTSRSTSSITSTTSTTSTTISTSSTSSTGSTSTTSATSTTSSTSSTGSTSTTSATSTASTTPPKPQSPQPHSLVDPTTSSGGARCVLSALAGVLAVASVYSYHFL